jgi:hypothetical protein
MSLRRSQPEGIRPPSVDPRNRAFPASPWRIPRGLKPESQSRILAYCTMWSPHPAVGYRGSRFLEIASAFEIASSGLVRVNQNKASVVVCGVATDDHSASRNTLSHAHDSGARSQDALLRRNHGRATE